MIRRPSEFSGNFEIEADVVIVGAGPGGGASAYKLSQSGKKVVVLEMGGSFQPKDFSRDGLKSLKNLYQDNGQRFTQGNTYFAAMSGKGVGGGGLVNSAIAFRPPDKAIRRWADEAQLREFSSESLKPFVDEVEKNVNIEIQDVQRLGENNIVFKEGLDKLGFRGGVVPRTTKGCVGCGICFYGCPIGAKQTVDKNFLASAMEKDADVYTHTRVERIEVDRRERRFHSLEAVIQDPDEPKPRARMKVRAKHLVLAAGAIGTPQILMKSQVGNSSGQVGKNFRCHPSTGVIGVFEKPIYGFRSVVQGYYSDQFSDDDLLLETYWAPPGIFAVYIPGLGLEATNLMKRFKNFAGAGAMIREESSGQVHFDGGRIQIEYNCNERDQLLLTQGLFRSAEILLAAGAEVVYADNPRKNIFSSLNELRDFFAQNKNLGPDIIREGNHGMGTCRMGENPKTSVVNSFGKLHEIDNIWIHDVSVFPSALGVNPQITIMALALRGAEYLNGHFS